MKILVLGGGNSLEREVSLRSARSVANAARQAGFEVEQKDPADGLGFLDSLDKSTLIFPILHGAGGEDGVIQKEFEKRSIPYLGSDSRSSEQCFDKWRTRQKLIAVGLPMPKGAQVNETEYPNHELSKKPHVLKVVHGGSSIGTLLVPDLSLINHASVKEIFKLDSQALLEELIVGHEITVPIFDTKALPVIEIVPPPDEEFDYENKYNGRTQEICPPTSVSDELQRQAQMLAEKVHEIMECRHLSRVDLMINDKNELFVLEINTMPGMTGQSLYPKSAAVSGMDMPTLFKKFVKLLQRDFNL